MRGAPREGELVTSAGTTRCPACRQPTPRVAVWKTRWGWAANTVVHRVTLDDRCTAGWLFEFDSWSWTRDGALRRAERRLRRERRKWAEYGARNAALMKPDYSMPVTPPRGPGAASATPDGGR